MPKTTRENIAKIVYDSLVSSELEAIDELNSTITGLTDAINNLSQVLATKKEPVQLEMFAKDPSTDASIERKLDAARSALSFYAKAGNHTPSSGLRVDSRMDEDYGQRANCALKIMGYEPKVEIETQKEEPKPVKKKAVKVYVQPVAEPVIEPVVETIIEETEKPEMVLQFFPIEIKSFADLQKKMTEELTGDFADKGAELIKKVLSFYKASKLREVPEDKYSEFYAKYQELKQE